MLKNSINKYYTTIARIKQAGGTKNESVLRRAFAELLQDYANKKELQLVEEFPYKTARIRPDGTLRTDMQLDWAYWESKDTKDELDTEIEKKLSIGYPTSNILFENSETAVLIQNGQEVMRIDILNEKQLDRILSELINCIPKEYQEFDKAIKQFKEDVPTIVKTLRNIIDSQYNTNLNYKNIVDRFLDTCKQSINPEITMSEIREMIIQHILTADIFDKIFGDSQFHRENNIAFQLQTVIDTFFTRQTKFQLLSGISHYYDLIRSRASQIADHQEKQKFLKAVYENFYSAYNPLGADRLGIVYTPNEIVKFMIESTDSLLDKYFDKSLADENVEILDPATGTGTFICDIIEHIPPHKLENKYKNEIHANEVAILPYYIANLNIEYTYQQKMNKYEPFNNLCFVDTLDNMGFGYAGKQFDLFGVSAENLERIKKQNTKKISVIIGNPPYNANQQNENENNKNKEYKLLDERIKNTYIKNSASQKTKVYDMYSRFFRWASDRINGGGIIAFITNRSFIDSKTYDGFRKTIAKEFDFVYIIDTQSDIRKNPKIAGTTHNVFGIQTGVAVMFLLRLKNNHNNDTEHKAKIFYFTLTDEMKKGEKLNWFLDNQLDEIPFERIRPDEKGYWLNITDSDFETLIPVCNKQTKLAKETKDENAIFKLHSLGVVTARDSWVYDFDETKLTEKVKFLIEIYNIEVKKYKGLTKNEIANRIDYQIKWTRAVKNDLQKGRIYKLNKKLILDSLYRPFVKKKLYFSKELNEMQYQLPIIFKNNNMCINFLSISSSNELSILISNQIFDYCLLKKGNGGTESLPYYRYDSIGNRTENITDWGLQQYQNQYSNENITKEDLFYYIYAVLHNPNYRKKYEQELKREYPRIPFYTDFRKWCDWGKQLAEIHLNFETINPYPLVENTFDIKAETKRQMKELSMVSEPEIAYNRKIKTKLKADKEAGIIQIDELTFLSGVPTSAWQYQLGSRSAIEWILDQYKEKEPNESIIAEKFNTYKFSEHKNHVIDLIKRVCNVSIETMQIVNEMQTTE